MSKCLLIFYSSLLFKFSTQLIYEYLLLNSSMRLFQTLPWDNSIKTFQFPICNIFNLFTAYDYAAEDEYDVNDIPIDQRAPDSYIAAGPPDSDYTLPDYELPAEEEEVEEVEEEIINLREDTDLIGEEEVSSEEQGYSYPVPENPLELPEKSSQSEALDLGLVDDAVAPLALYGAPAQPFELPPGEKTHT